MTHAFPEDELKPLSCKPQTRNRENPADIGLNDVLGNYSLTLIDSLSTLAILASGHGEDGRNALRDFQKGVKSLVDLYGDGEQGSCGSRACGFDLDSKVQVFETNIRGVGGLLSAHLFAVGELPIRGYRLHWIKKKDGTKAVKWKGFVYDGQLLRLAQDLASRLLPAFGTTTGLPYPRVNLRYGIPFYQDAEEGICRLDGTSADPREITETCAAGAGSLVLEFTTLSRLTGDERFETLAKKAFWSVWNRRSAIGLVAGGVDAESGQWTMPPLAGIGAGIDSFFEYAMKSHILLSGLPPNSTSELDNQNSFLQVWQHAHSAIKHHIHRSTRVEKHPYYGQSDLLTGAPRYNWIDNLSAYYPGLLTLAGELDEAIEAHLLFSALWTRYSALPERWHVLNGGFIDPNFKHWAGRPEFIESTYYLYQATKDPWYLHVGEMALRDIRRRCWTKCGWADLGDVVSGEQRDRMESFFLGETAKYLYLLFEQDHPLNKLDGGVVFSTEGHPLVIPQELRRTPTRHVKKKQEDSAVAAPAPTCPAPPPPLPLTISNTANRADLFHAAALANLHLVPINPTRSSPLLETSPSSPGISLADVRSPTNYTFYPWTLPQTLIPAKGSSSPILTPLISTLTFPSLASSDAGAAEEKGLIPLGALQKVLDGVLINSLSNVRLNMVQEPRSLLLPNEAGVMVEMEVGREFRVQGIANWALGRDEKVIVSGQALEGVSPADPHFTRMKDLEWVDLVVDVAIDAGSADVNADSFEKDGDDKDTKENGTLEKVWEEVEKMFDGLLGNVGVEGDASASSQAHQEGKPAQPSLTRQLIPAILPTGAGAAPLPPNMETTDILASTTGTLPFRNPFFLDDTLCFNNLPSSVAKNYNILVIRRGECSFSDKLANIPTYVPSPTEGLQLVIVLDDQSSSAATGELIRPLLDVPQKTPSGLDRRHPVAMCLVDGKAETEQVFRKFAGAVGSFDGKTGKLIEREVKGSVGTDGTSQGLGLKRRYWFESMGVPIGNLIVL